MAEDEGALDASSDADPGATPEVTPAAVEAAVRHPLRWAAAGVVLVAVAIAGVVAWRQVAPTVRARKYASVTYVVPKAPKLTAGDGETIYRIDPTRSSLTYRVQETFVGKPSSVATGVTNGLAGDVAIDQRDLAAARVGEIVANVEQFHSDNDLRDARLRQDFLQSNRYPLARFRTSSIRGLDGKLVAGRTYRFTMRGTVTLKGREVPVTFRATAKAGRDGTLDATATTMAKLSAFDAGPISIAGLLRTEDDVRLTLRLHLLDPARHAVPTTITGPKAKAPADVRDVSFAKTVQPILEQNCTSCHAPGGMGADHVRIATAGDARGISDGIKTVTTSRYMPPWPASDKGVPLKHKMSLTGREIADLAAWAEGGGRLDVDAGAKLAVPKPIAAVSPRRDVVMKVPGYLGSTDNTNDYRCFVLDPKITKPMYLTGSTFLADQIQELHHVQVFHISPSQKRNAARVEGKDGQPGWSCYAGPSLPGRPPTEIPGRSRNRDIGFAGQPHLVAGWVPGQLPAVYPEDSGIYLSPGDALVMQIHYHYSEKATRDESGLAIQLDPVSPKIKAMRVINPLGPVEIPCNPKDAKAPLCDREASIRDSVERFGPDGSGNESGLLQLCGQTAEQVAAAFDGNVARTRCNLRVPEDGTITAVLGHMHTLGKSIRLTLDPDTSKQQILLDIPRWSFDWQMNYALAKPIHVTGGQPIRLDCAWDRRVDPLREPRYITFAEGTEDEMCFATYAFIPDDQ